MPGGTADDGQQKKKAYIFRVNQHVCSSDSFVVFVVIHSRTNIVVNGFGWYSQLCNANFEKKGCTMKVTSSALIIKIQQ